MGEPTGNQSQKLERICILLTFQKGIRALSQILIATKRLHVQS